MTPMAQDAPQVCNFYFITLLTVVSRTTRTRTATTPQPQPPTMTPEARDAFASGASGMFRSQNDDDDDM